MFYQNNKIKDINFPTNGLMPDRVVEWVYRFRRNCPNCTITVSVSIDGFEETHDKQRGVPGNFYKALERVYTLGLGPHYINIGKISFNKLENKIKDLISNPDYQENAKKIAKKMCHEDGIKAFCDYVENLLELPIEESGYTNKGEGCELNKN